MSAGSLPRTWDDASSFASSRHLDENLTASSRVQYGAAPWTRPGKAGKAGGAGGATLRAGPAAPRGADALACGVGAVEVDDAALTLAPGEDARLATLDAAPLATGKLAATLDEDEDALATPGVE